MVHKRAIMAFLMLLTSLNFLYGQEKFEYSREFKFKNGIYLSVEDFKNNSPSLPLSAVANQSRDYLESTLCMRTIEFVDEGFINEVAAKEVWGICINGDPYVRHGAKGIVSRACFYKIFSIGSIATFFVQRTEMTNNWGSSSPFDTPADRYSSAMRAANPGKLQIAEFALDLNTGTAYNKNTEVSEIIDLIKQDDYFKDQKIKKKEVGIYITQYNKRHPFLIPIE